MQFTALLARRRSIRKYKDKRVDTELLTEIIQESTYAPSAGNEQPWKFIIVQNASVLKSISDDCRKNFLNRIAENPDDSAKKYENMLRKSSFNIFYNAPCLVIIFGESRVKNLVFDCTLAASYFMMSAAAKGLGTCWIHFGRELKDQGLLELIGVPDDHTIVAPIIVGYPAHEPNVPVRKEASITEVIT